ncbi:hypothetical protein ACHAXS_002889 [Conticribra weissflogii]
MTPNINNNDKSEHELFRFSVPTKQYDGRPAKKIEISEAESTKKGDDYFLYYSFERNRIKALIGDDADIHILSSNNIMRTGTIERSTRISFEVHPSLIYDERLTRDAGIGMDSESTDYVLELLDSR